MSGYKGKFKMALLKQEKDMKEKELQISKIVAKRMQVTKKIQKEEEITSLFHSQLEKGGAIDAAFFAASLDSGYIEKTKEDLRKIDLELKLENFEYQKLLKKKEIILEMDKRDERIFNEELKKKQQKKIIGLKIIEKMKEKRGE